jgi:hypothetical protein
MAAQENVNDVVMKLLSDVIGAEFFAEYDVSSDSTLTGDLEMRNLSR